MFALRTQSDSSGKVRGGGTVGAGRGWGEAVPLQERLRLGQPLKLAISTISLGEEPFPGLYPLACVNLVKLND